MTAARDVNIAPLVALVGNPNAGKTALFNALTGAPQLSAKDQQGKNLKDADLFA